jgi:hypothetical protein
MLTYDDCLGLSELTPEEIAVVARHEHLPEIVALEMGWYLCGTPLGKGLIRRMILHDIGQANERGDTQAVTELKLVLQHFVRTHPDRHGPAEPRPQTRDTWDLPAAPQDDGDRLTHALGLDTTAAPWVRERVEAYLAAMLRHFGLDPASVRERYRSELQSAEMHCATCTETGRCRRFLAGVEGSGPPSAFCPNAVLFAELQERSPRSYRTPAAE